MRSSGLFLLSPSPFPSCAFFTLSEKEYLRRTAALSQWLEQRIFTLKNLHLETGSDWPDWGHSKQRTPVSSSYGNVVLLSGLTWALCLTWEARLVWGVGVSYRKQWRLPQNRWQSTMKNYSSQKSID